MYSFTFPCVEEFMNAHHVVHLLIHFTPGDLYETEPETNGHCRFFLKGEDYPAVSCSGHAYGFAHALTRFLEDHHLKLEDMRIKEG